MNLSKITNTDYNIKIKLYTQINGLTSSQDLDHADISTNYVERNNDNEYSKPKLSLLVKDTNASTK